MPALFEVVIICHLLPGWNDGPSDLSELLQIARQAVECGVRTILEQIPVEMHHRTWNDENDG
jgi:tyrosine-protein phosphatase YwqE